MHIVRTSGATGPPTNSNFGLSGGPRLGVHGPTTWVPMGAQAPILSPKFIPGATEVFRKKSNFENFSGVTRQRTQQQFWGFCGGPWLGLYGPSSHSAQVPVLSPTDHPNPSQGRQKEKGKRQSLKNFQVPLNSLHNCNFGAFGGATLGVHGPSSHYVGPHGRSSTRIVHKIITQTHPWGDRRVSEKVEVWKICRCH